MKKIINVVFAVVAVAAASFGGYKAHGAYVAANMSEDELLMMENVEALSDEPCHAAEADIYTYNINMMEGYTQPYRIGGSAKSGFYISYNGKRMRLGCEANGYTHVRFQKCLTSKCNVCQSLGQKAKRLIIVFYQDINIFVVACGKQTSVFYKCIC